jgi:tRNA 2-thiouridine synthesizing protein A
MISNSSETVFVDARGMRCPLPLLKLKQALSTVSSGGRIELVSTDAGSQRDIPAYIAMSGHSLDQQCEQGNEFRFWITKGDVG